MGGTECPLGKTFFLHCQRRHPELPKIPTYLPLQSQLNEQVHQVIIRMSTPLLLGSRSAILPPTRGDFTHKPQVGFSGSIVTPVHPGEQVLQVGHILRDTRSGREFREHRKLFTLCPNTEIRLIDGKCFLKSFQNLSASRTGFYNYVTSFRRNFFLHERFRSEH